MANIRQTNFSAGELDPKLWGRTDLQKFGLGLRTMRNFFPSKQGAALSRPGTEFIAAIAYPAGHPGMRLLDFNYSDDESYVLLFGHLFLRFFSNGAPVLDGSGNVYQLATTFTDDQLSELQWAQSGDIVTITHPAHVPMELRRVAAADWTLSAVNFTAIAPSFRNIDTMTVTREPLIISQLIGVVNDSHPAREWRWKVTVFAQSLLDGSYIETTAADVVSMYDGTVGGVAGAVAATTVLPLYSDRAVTLRRPLIPHAPGTPPPGTPSLWFNYRPVAFNFYRGRGELFGLVGQTKTTDFVDTGDTPNYSVQPPLGSNPFVVIGTNGTRLRQECPIAVAYFQDRICFAGTTERPGDLFFSATSNYLNFDEYFLQKKGDALLYRLASRRRERARSLLPLNRLLVFTTCSVWSIAGQDANPLDFDSVDARVVEEVGASSLRPLSVEGAALYVRSKGLGARALVAGNTAAGYKGVDVSLGAQHLFSRYSILDWAYAEDPWGLVWAVRADGALLSFTFVPEEGTWAWARHDSLSGNPAVPDAAASVKSIVSVPETTHDAVYVLVERHGGIYLERLTSRQGHGLATDPKALDSSVRYVGPPSITVFGNLTHLEGATVYAVAAERNPDGKVVSVVYGPLVVEGGEVGLPVIPPGIDGTLTLDIGLLFTADLETLDVGSTQARTKQKAVTHVSFEVDQTQGLSAGQDFEHLDAPQLRNVADGYGGVSAASALVRVAVASNWDMSARAALRQTDPLPVTVLGITREVDSGD